MRGHPGWIRSGWACAVATAGALLAVPATARGETLLPGVGVSESLTLPGVTHYAVYIYAGATLAFQLGERWYLSPSLYLEIAPEVGRGGGLATLTLSRTIGTWGTADLIGSFAHDQDHLDFGSSIFSAGIGGGLSIFAGDHVLVSPSVSVFRVVDDASWSLTPALAVGYAL